MKPIEQIRRENLAAEVRRLGGQGQFAEIALGGKDKKTRVYQWLTSNPKQVRNLGRTTARMIEPLLGRETGWFDVDHAATEASSTPSSYSDRALASGRTSSCRSPEAS